MPPTLDLVHKRPLTSALRPNPALAARDDITTDKDEDDDDVRSKNFLFYTAIRRTGLYTLC